METSTTKKTTTLARKRVRRPRSSKFKTDLTLLAPGNKKSKRFIRLPYNLFTELISNNGNEATTSEALVLLIANVSYTEYEIHDDLICHRGESFRSKEGWSKIFNWDRSKTRRFFDRLREMNIIEHENMGSTTRLKIINYDYYVGSPNNEEETYTKDFEDFWDEYHRITMLRSTDKAAASRIWKKLSAQEKTKAKAKIGNYYYNLGKVSHCVKAVNYLKNKNFNDQFYLR